MMADINITYETLYEILRNEKNREDIQELSPTYYEDVITYLKKNKEMLDEAIRGDYSEDEKEELSRQVKNIRMMIKEIYERREKKIINLALNKSRTRSDSMEADTILVQEKEIYTRFVEIMDCFRSNILSRTLKCLVPISNDKTCSVDFSDEEENQGIIVPKENHSKKDNNPPEIKNSTIPNPKAGLSKEEKTDVTESAASRQADQHYKDPAKDEQDIESWQNKKEGSKKLRFKEIVPKFLGKELEVYGPFEEDDIATLPEEFANILIRKGKAEEIA
jgi:DNA replication initiation complex subunit (GINS family)